MSVGRSVGHLIWADGVVVVALQVKINDGGALAMGSVWEQQHCHQLVQEDWPPHCALRQHDDDYGGVGAKETTTWCHL